MALLQIIAATFGSGGSNMAPQGTTGETSIGDVLAAQREDAFFARFDWASITQAAASNLATLVSLVNAVTVQMYILAPVGSRGFGVRNLAPADTAPDVTAFMISQVNGLKAALVATASVDYSGIAATDDATDLATAIVLANAIRTALGIS